jgi:hypothetical protein
VKFTHRADVDLDGLITPNDASNFGTFYDESLPQIQSRTNGRRPITSS